MQHNIYFIFVLSWVPWPQVPYVSELHSQKPPDYLAWHLPKARLPCNVCQVYLYTGSSFQGNMQIQTPDSLRLLTECIKCKSISFKVT